MNRIAEKVALAAGPTFDGLQIAAEWMEDCASMVAGKSEEVRKEFNISTTELSGALRGIEAEQRAKGRDENLEKISKDVQTLLAEVDGLNRLRREVARRVVVKLAGVERGAVSIQKRLMEARGQ